MKNKNTYLFILFAVTNLSWFYITPIMFSFPIKGFPIFYYILRGLLLLFSVFLLVKILAVYIKQKLNSSVKGMMALIFVFLFLFYVSEFVFTFVAQTNGTNNTYTSKTWFYKYWRLNPQGYRDVDYQKLSETKKPIIFFSGDSYTEGHGIKSPDDRFSNIVRNKFPNYTVYNGGKCGWGIFEEINQITQMPIRPNYIFLQLFSNDWDYLLDKLPPTSSLKPNVLFAETNNDFFSKYSVSCNYLFANFNNIIENISLFNRITDAQFKEGVSKFKITESLKNVPKNGLDFLYYAYQHNNIPKDSLNIVMDGIISSISPNFRVVKDSALFSDYLNKLTYLNNVCNHQNTQLIVMPFPSFDVVSIQIFENYTLPPLIDLLKKRGLKVINVLPDLQKANLKYYSVNKYDAHANEASNAVIANTIIHYMHDSLNIH